MEKKIIAPEELTAEKKYNLQVEAMMKTKTREQEVYGDKDIILDEPGNLSKKMAAMEQNIKLMEKELGMKFEQPVWFVGKPEPRKQPDLFIGWIAKPKINLDKTQNL